MRTLIAVRLLAATPLLAAPIPLAAQDAPAAPMGRAVRDQARVGER
jgi:hypothetical protein